MKKRLKKYAIPEINAWIFAENKQQFEEKRLKILNRDKKYNAGAITTYNPQCKQKRNNK
jgi:hypothetical protein